MLGSCWGWAPGVPVRETGECDRSEVTDAAICDTRRCGLMPLGVEISGGGGGRPFCSNCLKSATACVNDGQLLHELTFFLAPWLAVLTRLRLLITSVLRLIGRGRPCSLRKSPQALQRTEPASSRRHSGVVEVWQFWQTGCVKGGLWSALVNEAAMAAAIAIAIDKGTGVEKVEGFTVIDCEGGLGDKISKSSCRRGKGKRRRIRG